LGSTEVAKWAQTDVPVEATAIFPADEPQGWPASDYRRATILYLDGHDRNVNTASPGGGIVTSEYNSYGDVTRNLSADDREAALKEGAKSAEVSQTLDTQNTYGGEGTELLSTLGPLHSVKLASGATVQARKHVVLNYDEGAPEPGGPYRLVTKVTESAQISGEPEADIRTTTKSYSGQNNLGWTLREPTATKADPSGLKLINSTVYDPTSGNVTETRTPGANPVGEEVLPPYVYKTSFGGSGTGNGQFSKPGGITVDSEGNIWVVDTANSRVEEFSSSGTFIRKFGRSGLNGYGNFKEPQGIAIDGQNDVWIADSGNKLLQIYSHTGSFLGQIELLGVERPTALAYSPNAATGEGLMYVVDGNKVLAYTAEWERSYGFGEGGTGNGQLKNPKGIAIDAHSNVWVADTGNNRIQEFHGYGGYIKQFGTVGTGNGQFKEPSGIGFDNEGNLFVADAGNNRAQSFTAASAYRYQFGTVGSGEGQLKAPAALGLDRSNNAYVLDTGNNRVEKWLSSAALHESSGNGGTHGMQTIYYTVAANSEVSACGVRPEWAGLPCEKRPAAQPETSGLPNLPVTTITYNIWDEPVVSTETVGSTTRTNTNVYDEAGRLTNDTVASTIGTSLPSVTLEYNSETGDQTKASTTVEGTTRTLESVYDKRGERSSYEDADGNTSTFGYDPYGRLESVNDGKGTQTYTYDTTTGFLSKLVDSAAGGFAATYDAEGNLKAVGYPNGMSVNHVYDATGSETGVEYVKTTHCSSGCVWYSQTVSPSIHDQTLSQSSTLSSQSYTYDAAGRLTQTQDTPTGEGCTTRIYTYDEETNATSLTARPPGSAGKCATEEGTATNHNYDTANRLTDAGIGYDALGDITKLPAGDAGGYELTSAFYADETLATQTQNGQTLGYYLDPSGRDRQIISTGKTNSTVTYHYAGGGRAPSWTEETSGKWTRNIYAFEGLVATQNSGESPVLQIQDVKGDVVGTASLSETATGLLSKGDATEYGVPRTGSPPKYSWQGALALRTELPSGVIAMGARSYVPSIGRFLQPDPIEGGSANEYAYTYGDPINTADPSGEYTVATPSWVRGFLNEQAEIATEAAIQRAAEEQAAREEAEAKALEALEEAAEAAEAWTEASAGGGKKGKKGKSGGKVSAGSAYSCNALECEKGPLQIHCDARCKAKRNEAEEKRKEKEKRKREEKERFEEELECGHVVSGYRPGEDPAVHGDGLYYGDSRSKDVYCGIEGGDPTLPCLRGCEGGFEAWQQWPGHEPGRKPDEQSIASPRQWVHAIRA
jgi:RHS repeat-associated protein